MILIAAVPGEVLAIVSALLGGGFITAIVQVYRARPERDNIVVSGTANAAEVFRGLNEALYHELERERLKCGRAELWTEILEEEMRKNNINIPYNRRPK